MSWHLLVLALLFLAAVGNYCLERIEEARA